MDFKELTVEKLVIRTPRTREHIEIIGDSITFYDVRNLRRAALELNSDGAPSLEFMDAHGEGRIKMGVSIWGHSTLEIGDAKSRSCISLTTEGQTRIALCDDKDKFRITILVDQDDGAPAIELADENEKLRLKLALEGDGTPIIETINEKGQGG